MKHMKAGMMPECMMGRKVKHNSPAELSKEPITPPEPTSPKLPQDWRQSPDYYPLRENPKTYKERMDRLNIPEWQRWHPDTRRP